MSVDIPAGEGDGAPLVPSNGRGALLVLAAFAIFSATDAIVKIMAVAIPGGDPRRAAAPRALFETPLRVSNTFDQFAVASKERFLFRLPFGDDPQVPVNVIVGWDR